MIPVATAISTDTTRSRAAGRDGGGAAGREPHLGALVAGDTDRHLRHLYVLRGVGRVRGDGVHAGGVQGDGRGVYDDGHALLAGIVFFVLTIYLVATEIK